MITQSPTQHNLIDIVAVTTKSHLKALYKRNLSWASATVTVEREKGPIIGRRPLEDLKKVVVFNIKYSTDVLQI